MRYEILLLKTETTWVDFPSDLGTFDEANKMLIVAPTNPAYAGTHSIRVNFHGQDYLTG